MTLTWPSCLLVDVVSSNMSTAVITIWKRSDQPVPDISQPTA